MFNNYPDVVSVDQLTEMLGVGRNTAYKLVKNNQIKSIRIGRQHKIPKIYVIDYLTASIPKIQPLCYNQMVNSGLLAFKEVVANDR